MGWYTRAEQGAHCHCSPLAAKGVCEERGQGKVREGQLERNVSWHF